MLCIKSEDNNKYTRTVTMKQNLLIMSIITFLCNVFGCTSNAKGFQSVGVTEFDKAISDTSAICLDVRTVEEYQDGHIVGAKNIDVLQSDFEIKVSGFPYNRTICLYCRSGNRSKKAATILARNGYKVIELNSGFNGWKAAGKTITK